MNTPPRKEQESGLYAPVWRKINQMIDYMREISVVNGRDVRVSRTMNGTMLLGTAKGEEAAESQPATINQYRFKAMGDDTIECVEWDGLAEGSTVTINKPFILRRTPFDNQTITYTTERTPSELIVSYVYTTPVKRTARIAAETETQIVLPRFTLNDIIYATTCSQLGSGNDGLIDINADGRTWAAIF